MTVLELKVKHDNFSLAILEIHIGESNRDECKDLISECKLFNNTVTCQILVTFSEDTDGKKQMIVVKLKDDGLLKPYKLHYYSVNMTDVVLKSNSNKWQLIYKKACDKTCDLLFNLIPGKCEPFKELYDDTILTDFKLYGESDDTGVSFHRNILGLSSPVFKSMLLGDWKETREGNVQLPFVSKNTLQHLKDYIYLKNLPNLLIDCAKLLCLANYYMLHQLPELERNIEEKLRQENTTFMSLWPWFEFSVNQKHTRMLDLLWFAGNRSMSSIGYKFKRGPHEALFELTPKGSSREYHNLYEDKDFIDFELRTGDNSMYSSVDVHRNVIAAYSPVLKSLFQNEWKDLNYGFIQLNGISKLTLQHFKDFIYLQRVPDDSKDCAKLITLAAHYEIPELEKEAAIKIAENLTAENIWEWFEYCVEQRHEYLLVEMLKNIYEHNKIDSIKDYLPKLKN